ncbi:hypothetical protein ACP3V5_06080 [Vibrio maritimus]
MYAQIGNIRKGRNNAVNIPATGKNSTKQRSMGSESQAKSSSHQPTGAAQFITYTNLAGDNVNYWRNQISLTQNFQDKHVATNLADAEDAFNWRIEQFNEIVNVNSTAIDQDVWKDALIAAVGNFNPPPVVRHHVDRNVMVNVNCRNLTENGMDMYGNRLFIDNGVENRAFNMTFRVYRNNGRPTISIRHIH